MNPPQGQSENTKIKIASQIAELSKLLGMIPSDEAIHIREPLTENYMLLSDWFSSTRNLFLTLSLLISKELDIQLQ